MEQFKDLPGWEGFYQVSNYGTVKSLERFVERKSNQSENRHKWFVPEKTLKNNVNENGYAYVRLCGKGSKFFFVHRLTACVFIPNPENKPCINHKDGNPLNNNVENLEWCTYSENRLHAVRVLGARLHYKGLPSHLHHHARPIMATEKDGSIKLFACITYAARYYNADKANISTVCRGLKKSCKGVKFQYDIRE